MWRAAGVRLSRAGASLYPRGIVGLSRSALAAILIACAAGCAGTPRAGLARVLDSGELRWGADVQGGQPYAFEDPARPGDVIGFEVEIAAALARELGVRPRFVQCDWSTLVPSLERGTFDVALNGLEVTEARARRIRFTRPYHVFAERLVARAGDVRVRDLASLRGLRVGTLANSLAWDLLDRAGAVRLPYEGVEEPYVDLAAGRSDAVLLDDIIAARYGQKPGLTVVGDVAEGRYAVGVARGEDDLHAAVDAALGRIAASGELRAILARWGLDSARQAEIGAAPRAMASGAGAAASGAGAAWPEGDGASPRLSARHARLFLEGAGVTLVVSAGAMVLAVALGLVLAVTRLPAVTPVRRLLAGAATVYVEVVRGTPVLLQLYVLYYGLAGVLALDALTAAVIGLGLNYAAYEAEIYRGGIAAVPRGQIEAAQALGMGEALALRRVVLPQALRFSLPGMANDFIALLKDSSLVSVITVVELTKRMTIAAVDLGDWIAPGLLCAALYLGMSVPLGLLARRLETRLAGGRT